MQFFICYDCIVDHEEQDQGTRSRQRKITHLKLNSSFRSFQFLGNNLTKRKRPEATAGLFCYARKEQRNNNDIKRNDTDIHSDIP